MTSVIFKICHNLHDLDTDLWNGHGSNVNVREMKEHKIDAIS